MSVRAKLVVAGIWTCVVGCSSSPPRSTTDVTPEQPAQPPVPTIEEDLARPTATLPVEPEEVTGPIEFCGEVLERNATYVDCDQDLDDVAALARLPGLISLKLQGALADPSGLAKLTTLESLYVRDVEDLGWAASLHRLQTLHVIGRYVRAAYKGPASPALESEYTPVADLTPLRGITALEDLSVSGQFSDVSPIADLPLRRLDLSSPALEDISALRRLARLEHLKLNESGVSDLGPIAAASTLVSLSFYKTPVEDLTPLADLTGLRSLNFSYTPVRDISAISELRELTFLGMSGSKTEDLAPLAKLRKIERFEMSGGAATDLSVLANLTKLRVLLLPYTQGSDYRFLTRLDQLWLLRLEGSTFRDLSLLPRLRSLAQVVLDKRDFSPIEIRRLERKRPKLAVVMV